MGVWATFGMLADWRSSLQSFVNVFLSVYILLILIYVLLSWFRLPYNLWLNRIQRFLYDVCEPYIRLFRRVLPATGALDFSPILALIALGVIDRFLIWLLEHFH